MSQYNNSLPPPPTSANVDLRQMPGMLLDVQRLLDSDRQTECSAESNWIALTLWCKSWHLVPAGSLPNDDKKLASFAGFGRSVGEWLKVKDEALRGYQLHSDDRLYHSHLSRVVNTAWESHLSYLYKKLVDRLKKADRKTPGSKNEWISAGCPNEWPIEFSALETSKTNESEKEGNSLRNDVNSPRILVENPLKRREGKEGEESYKNSLSPPNEGSSNDQGQDQDKLVYDDLVFSGWVGSREQARSIRIEFSTLQQGSLYEAIKVDRVQCDGWSKQGGTKYLLEHAKRMRAEQQANHHQKVQLPPNQPPGRMDSQGSLTKKYEHAVNHAKQEQARMQLAQAFLRLPVDRLARLQAAFKDSSDSFPAAKALASAIGWNSTSAALWGPLRGWLAKCAPDLLFELTGAPIRTNVITLPLPPATTDSEGEVEQEGLERIARMMAVGCN